MSSVKDLLRGDVVDGSGTANYVSKWSDADTITNSVIYDDGTNVGIGTSSPTNNLSIIENSGNPAGINAENTEGGFSIRTNAADTFFDVDDDFIFRNSSETERMRIDSSGNVGITTNAVLGAGLGFAGNTSSAGAGKIELYDSTTAALIIDGFGAGYLPNGGIQFRVAGSEKMRITSGGNVCIGTTGAVSRLTVNGGVAPNTPNSHDIGTAVYPWRNIYAQNTTIQTSDRNTKQDEDFLNEAELRVAIASKSLLKKFRWKSSVQEKGDEARIHFGIIAQDLKQAFENEGLDAGRYAMFIKNTWWEKEVIEINEEGNETTKTEIFKEYEEGAVEKTRLGIRYSELLAFIIAAL